MCKCPFSCCPILSKITNFKALFSFIRRSMLFVLFVIIFITWLDNFYPNIRIVKWFQNTNVDENFRWISLILIFLLVYPELEQFNLFGFGGLKTKVEKIQREIIDNKVVVVKCSKYFIKNRCKYLLDNDDNVIEDFLSGGSGSIKDDDLDLSPYFDRGKLCKLKDAKLISIDGKDLFYKLQEKENTLFYLGSLSFSYRNDLKTTADYNITKPDLYKYTFV